jgi:hypothetical protein
VRAAQGLAEAWTLRGDANLCMRVHASWVAPQLDAQASMATQRMQLSLWRRETNDMMGVLQLLALTEPSIEGNTTLLCKWLSAQHVLQERLFLLLEHFVHSYPESAVSHHTHFPAITTLSLALHFAIPCSPLPQQGKSSKASTSAALGHIDSPALHDMQVDRRLFEGDAPNCDLARFEDSWIEDDERRGALLEAALKVVARRLDIEMDSPDVADDHISTANVMKRKRWQSLKGVTPLHAVALAQALSCKDHFGIVKENLVKTLWAPTSATVLHTPPHASDTCSAQNDLEGAAQRLQTTGVATNGAHAVVLSAEEGAETPHVAVQARDGSTQVRAIGGLAEGLKGHALHQRQQLDESQWVSNDTSGHGGTQMQVRGLRSTVDRRDVKGLSQVNQAEDPGSAADVVQIAADGHQTSAVHSQAPLEAAWTGGEHKHAKAAGSTADGNYGHVVPPEWQMDGGRESGGAAHDKGEPMSFMVVHSEAADDSTCATSHSHVQSVLQRLVDQSTKLVRATGAPCTAEWEKYTARSFEEYCVELDTNEIDKIWMMLLRCEDHRGQALQWEFRWLGMLRRVCHRAGCNTSELHASLLQRIVHSQGVRRGNVDWK